MRLFRRQGQNRPFNRCGQISHSWSDLMAWYQTRLGQTLSQQERELLGNTLADLFGYYLLQIGRLDEQNWLDSSRVSHCEVMDIAELDNAGQKPAFRGLPEHLPVKSDCIDVLILPHVLEYSQHPHTVLREVERILIPEGHVVLLVFNPFSLWRFWQWLPGLRHKIPWCGRFLSTARIKDWLALMGFDVVRIQGYFFRPALQQLPVMQRMSFIERLGVRFWPFFGAANLIVARKRVMTLTPLGRSWTRPRPAIVRPAGLAEPFQKSTKPEQE